MLPSLRERILNHACCKAKLQATCRPHVPAHLEKSKSLNILGKLIPLYTHVVCLPLTNMGSADLSRDGHKFGTTLSLLESTVLFKHFTSQNVT